MTSYYNYYDIYIHIFFNILVPNITVYHRSIVAESKCQLKEKQFLTIC